MDSASIQFVLFGLGVAIVSNFSRSRTWRFVVLMLSSLIFLGLQASDPIVFLPLAGFLLLGYAGIFLLRRGWSKALVWSILIIIFAYIWLKKYTFLPAGIFIQHPYFTLGLSYIFFRMLHLLIDTGDGSETQPVGLGAYLLYTLNFTTFVSGPIQRYEEFAADQFTERPIPLGPRIIGAQVERLILGFFKVNVLAMLLEASRQDALAQMFEPLPLSIKMLAAFRLTVLCPFFLYLNFSGYIDIVIALARLMRVRLPENFNRPFSASSFLDFWSRWHITLSAWLKTYVYNPLLLAMMRRVSSPGLQPFLGVVSFFVTFFLAGIWHGRTSEFLFFGLLQGGGVSINKLWQVGLARAMGRKEYKKLAGNAVYIAFGRGLTFSWFALTLFWFWAAWHQIDSVLKAIGVVRWMAVWLAIWVCGTAVLALWEWLRGAVLSIDALAGPLFTHRYARVVFSTTLAFIAFVMTILLNQPAPDIVYKVF